MPTRRSLHVSKHNCEHNPKHYTPYTTCSTQHVFAIPPIPETPKNNTASLGINVLHNWFENKNKCSENSVCSKHGMIINLANLPTHPPTRSLPRNDAPPTTRIVHEQSTGAP